MIKSPFMNFNLPTGGLSIAPDTTRFQPIPQAPSPLSPQPGTGDMSGLGGLFNQGASAAEARAQIEKLRAQGGINRYVPGGGGNLQYGGPDPFTGQFRNPPPGMMLNPDYRPSNRLTSDVLLSDLEYRPIQGGTSRGGTIAPGRPSPPPMQEIPLMGDPSSSGKVKNPFYSPRTGGIQTTEVRFSDQEYVTPDALKNYQDRNQADFDKFQKAASDPNRVIKEIAGQKYYYSPSTDVYELYDGPASPAGPSANRPGSPPKPLPDFTLSGPAPTLPSITSPTAPPSEGVPALTVIIPGEKNGVPGYYTDSSMKSFVPYSQTPGSQDDSVYAGGGNLYNPETGRFENITTGATPVATPTPPKKSGGSVTDFLFEGSPPTPGTARETSRTELPEWYTEYATDMLARARGAADMPYQAFPGPRIAPFTPTEREGMDVTKRAAGAYEPFLSRAGDILGQVGGKSAFGAAAPFIGEGAGYTRGAADTSAMPTAERYFREALGRTPTGAAAPYAEQAARMFPQAAEAYMSPYTKGVIEELGNIGLEQLQEKYLPEIGEEFIRAGQFGGSRMGEFGARALRDVQRSILGEQRKALESGYKTAADIYGTDVGRQAELARLMGTFGGQEQEFMGDVGKSLAGIQQEDLARILRAGGQMGEFGKLAGALGSEDLDRLLNLSGRYADIAGLAQKYGLGAGEAISGVGEKERAMQQANLELAYKDFLEQRGYPKEQVEFMARMLSGINLPETRISETITTPAMPAGETGVQKIAGGARGVLQLLEEFENLFGKKGD